MSWTSLIFHETRFWDNVVMKRKLQNLVENKWNVASSLKSCSFCEQSHSDSEVYFHLLCSEIVSVFHLCQHPISSSKLSFRSWTGWSRNNYRTFHPSQHGPLKSNWPWSIHSSGPSLNVNWAFNNSICSIISDDGKLFVSQLERKGFPESWGIIGNFVIHRGREVL